MRTVGDVTVTLSKCHRKFRFGERASCRKMRTVGDVTVTLAKFQGKFRFGERAGCRKMGTIDDVTMTLSEKRYKCADENLLGPGRNPDTKMRINV